MPSEVRTGTSRGRCSSWDDDRKVTWTLTSPAWAPLRRARAPPDGPLPHPLHDPRRRRRPDQHARRGDQLGGGARAAPGSLEERARSGEVAASDDVRRTVEQLERTCRLFTGLAEELEEDVLVHDEPVPA